MTSKTIWPKDWKQGMVKTLNGMGIMTTELSPTSKDFVKFSKKATKPVLDVGCAFGIATFAALEKGAKVIACDLEKKHIDFIEANAPLDLKPNLQFVVGEFPHLTIKNNSLSAIHIAMVLHFMKGDGIENALKKCFDWLEPGGKIFTVNMTTSLGLFDHKKLTAEFLERKNKGVRWPNEIQQRQFARENWAKQLPELAFFFDIETARELFKSAGFEIEEIGYFCYENIPDFYKTNGKEYIGLIAKKPKNS